MNLHRYVAIAITCVLALAVPFAQTPDDPLATVRRLHESASYQEALAILGALSPEAHADQIALALVFAWWMDKLKRR
jgi:hypothetical protein